MLYAIFNTRKSRGYIIVPTQALARFVVYFLPMWDWLPLATYRSQFDH